MCVCVCVYIYIYIDTYTHTHIHTHIHTLCVCVCVCVCVCIHTHIHTCRRSLCQLPERRSGNAALEKKKEGLKKKGGVQTHTPNSKKTKIQDCIKSCGADIADSADDDGAPRLQRLECVIGLF